MALATAILHENRFEHQADRCGYVIEYNHALQIGFFSSRPIR